MLLTESRSRIRASSRDRLIGCSDTLNKTRFCFLTCQNFKASLKVINSSVKITANRRDQRLNVFELSYVIAARVAYNFNGFRFITSKFDIIVRQPSAFEMEKLLAHIAWNRWGVFVINTALICTWTHVYQEIGWAGRQNSSAPRGRSGWLTIKQTSGPRVGLLRKKTEERFI